MKFYTTEEFNEINTVDITNFVFGNGERSSTFSNIYIDENATIYVKLRKQNKMHPNADYKELALGHDKRGYVNLSVHCRIYNNLGTQYAMKNLRYQVAVLVLYAFKPSEFYKLRSGIDAEIDHIDSNKANNNINNLEIVTHAENCRRRDLRLKEIYGDNYNNIIRRHRPIKRGE